MPTQYSPVPKCDIRKLQRIQNIAAKLILQKSKFDSVTECLEELHWLPVQARIVYKFSTPTFKCFNNITPDYLNDLAKTPMRHGLRVDTDDKLLAVPFTRRAICLSFF